MPFPRISLVACAALPLAACAPDPEPSTAPAVQSLVNGDDIFPGELEAWQEHSWTVEWRFPAAGVPNGWNVCSGVRIAPRTLLTAAHCTAALHVGDGISIWNGSPASELAEVRVHRIDLVDGVLPTPATADTTSDAAIITFDGRIGGRPALVKLYQRVGVIDLGEDPDAVQLFHVGYGANDAGLIKDPADDHGADTLRTGVADVVTPPAVLGADLAKSRYTRGADINTHGTASQADDTIVGSAVTLWEGDSGGPAFSDRGYLIGVNSGRVNVGTAIYNRVATPPVPWVVQRTHAPVIDVVGKTLIALDPTQERPGRRVVVEAGVEEDERNVLYVRGWGLEDAQWMIAGQLLAVGVEAVEPAYDEEPDGGVTVKLTFPEEAPTVSGVLEAFVDDSVVTSSATTVSVAKHEGTDWRRYGVYRALACGEEYGGVVGTCDDMEPGLSAITIVRSTVHESQVAGQTVRLEKIEDAKRTAAFPSTVIVNHVPRDALELGYYQFATTACPPNNACASVFIDFQYREEEIVERYGSVCRRTSSQFHKIVPWVWLLGEKADVTDVMKDLLDETWPSFNTGPEQRSDSGLLPCGEVLATYPEPRPYDLGEHGAVVPHPGWTRM